MSESEQPEEVVRETARGRSSRTPGLAIGGVALTVGAAFVVVGAVALLVYLLS